MNDVVRQQSLRRILDQTDSGIHSSRLLASFYFGSTATDSKECPKIEEAIQDYIASILSTWNLAFAGPLLDELFRPSSAECLTWVAKCWA
jgi:hypothetical protein